MPSRRRAPTVSSASAASGKLPGLLRELGLDPDAMFARVGLPPGALDDADARASYRQLARLLHEAAGDAHCPHLGLLAGQLWHLEDFGLLGDLMRNSRTLGEALRSFTVFHHLYSESGLVFLFTRGDWVEFGYAIYRRKVRGSTSCTTVRSRSA